MLNLRTPKGTVDLNPQQAYTQNLIIDKVKKIFEQHAGVPISTPAFELRDILTNKYGDDSKLIYNLEDQGGDICSLRYDLTVPFSRYLCMNKTQKLRKYQIGNVFRRDNPSFKTGRLREFIQADFDICGSNLPMVDDSETIKMIYDILMSLNLPYSLVIKVNDRRILIGLLEKFDIPEEIRGSVCSTIDKAGKLTNRQLVEEFVSKGLNSEQISQVMDFMNLSKPQQATSSFTNSSKPQQATSSLSLSGLKESNEMIFSYLKDLNSDNLDFNTGVSEMELLFKYLEIYKVPNVVLDLSLARGLDYYTGLIIEAAYDNVEVGSVAGGGRYDNLCKSLSEGSFSVPCVGFSIGITRLFALSEMKMPTFDVFVGSAHGLFLEDRMDILSLLWSNGLKCNTFTGKRVNYANQMEYAKKNNFKCAIFTGTNEVENDVFVFVDLGTMEKQEIKREELITFILQNKILN